MAHFLNSSKTFPTLRAVSKRTGKAIVDYGMIEEGDRIAVAVSGGKDSLSLLHVLRDRQRVAPVRFDFFAVHVNFGLFHFSPERLIRYFEAQGFSYHVESVVNPSGQRWEESDCFWWSRQRRKALFELAARLGIRKIAFGHHMDDIVETIILNQFYHAEVSAMKPRQELFGGKIVLIRPLAYVRERDMERLANKLGIETIGQARCAHEETSHRLMIKQMLRQFEKENPQVIPNIFKSLQNIKSDYLLKTSDRFPSALKGVGEPRSASSKSLA